MPGLIIDLFAGGGETARAGEVGHGQGTRQNAPGAAMTITWGELTPEVMGDVTRDDVAVIVGLMNQEAQEPVGCECCVWFSRWSENEYGGPYYVECEKRPGMANLKAFPFKEAPGTCFHRDFWQSTVCFLVNPEKPRRDKWAACLWGITDDRGAIKLNARNQARVAAALARYMAQKPEELA